MKDARERKSIKRLASLLIFAAGLFLFTACGGPETAPPYLGTYMDADGGRIVVDETGVTVNGATHAYTATESGGVWTLAAGTETLYVFDGGAVLCADAAAIDTGWSDGVTDNVRTDSAVTEDISVTAQFAPLTFTLSYTAGTGGTIQGETEQTVTFGGSGSAVTAVPDTGYAFTGWSDGVTDNI